MLYEIDFGPGSIPVAKERMAPKCADSINHGSQGDAVCCSWIFCSVSASFVGPTRLPVPGV